MALAVTWGNSVGGSSWIQRDGRKRAWTEKEAICTQQWMWDERSRQFQQLATVSIGHCCALSFRRFGRVTNIRILLLFLSAERHTDAILTK